MKKSAKFNWRWSVTEEENGQIVLTLVTPKLTKPVGEITTEYYRGGSMRKALEIMCQENLGDVIIDAKV